MVTHQTTTNYEGTTVLCQADHFEKSFNGSMMRKPSTEYPYALNTRASLGADIFCVITRITEKGWVTPWSTAMWKTNCISF